jgi:hypothetical protein
LRARLRSQVDSSLLANPKFHVRALQLFEAIGLDAHGISARKQLRSVVLSGVIGGQRARDASVFVYERYRGARYDPAALVCNRAENTSVTALGKQRYRKQQHTQSGPQQKRNSPRKDPKGCARPPRNRTHSLTPSKFCDRPWTPTAGKEAADGSAFTPSNKQSQEINCNKSIRTDGHLDGACRGINPLTSERPLFVAVPSNIRNQFGR